jgi:hypothetical protein
MLLTNVRAAHEGFTHPEAGDAPGIHRQQTNAASCHDRRNRGMRQATVGDVRIDAPRLKFGERGLDFEVSGRDRGAGQLEFSRSRSAVNRSPLATTP